METIQIIGLLVGIAFLIFGAYKGIGALPLTLAAGLIVVLTNGMPVWESFAGNYLTGYVSFLNSWLLVFASSAVYAKLMEDSGSAVAIAYKCIDWFGRKRVMLVCFVATCILTYGGVSLFVAIYAMAPIMITLFKEADIPKKLTMAPFIAGSCTLTISCLPGSTQLTNVIPSNFLGTGLTAAPVLGIICGVIMFVLCYLYMIWEEKREKKLDHHFEFGPNDDPAKYAERQDLPVAGIAFFPMIILLIIIIGGGRFVSNTSMLIVCGMIIASLLVLVLNWKKFPNKLTLLNAGFGGVINSFGGPCAVVAFGSLVKAAPAFQSIINWLMVQDMNPYIKAAMSTAIICGVTGSSSGGLTITFQTIGDYLLNSGANLESLHRLMAIAAGTLDSLPHAAGYFLMFGYMGLTHKDSYKYAGVTSVLIPIIVLIFVTFPLVLFLGL